MILNEKELKTYDVEPCSELKEEKIKKFYVKLNITENMTIEGFYIVFWRELQVLNLDRIRDFEQLCIKHVRYKKYLRRVENRKKLRHKKLKSISSKEGE